MSNDLETFIRDAELSILDCRTLDTPNSGPFAGHPAFDVTIAKRGNEYPMRVEFHVGVGGDAPTLADVLDCIASDSAGYRNARDFRDWCGEYGYDSDSREAHATYTACEDQARRLSKLLLDSELEDRLLFDTERL